MSTSLKRYDERDSWSLAALWHERYPTYLKVDVVEGDIDREDLNWNPFQEINKADVARAERRLKKDFIQQHLVLEHALRTTRITGACDGTIDLNFTLLSVRVIVDDEPIILFGEEESSESISIEWDFRLTGPTPVLQEIKAHFYFGHGPFGCGVWADQS